MLIPGELFMIMDLHRQGLSVSAIARRLELDRKTVRKCIARGLEPPAYGPRAPRPQKIDRYVEFIRDRLKAYPQLSAVRLLWEIQPLAWVATARSSKLSETCVQHPLSDLNIVSRLPLVSRLRWTSHSFGRTSLATHNTK